MKHVLSILSIAFLCGIFPLTGFTQNQPAFEQEQAVSVPPPSQAPISSTAIAPNPDFIKTLEAAYNNNPSLKAQREQLKFTDERMSVAVSGLRPTVNMNYSDGRRRSETGASRDWTYQDTKSRQLSVSQPLFRGGSTFSDIKSARNTIYAGREQLFDATQQTLLQAVESYVDVAQAQSVRDLSQKNVDVLGEQLRASQQRFDVGEVTRTDVAQSEARLSRAKAELAQAQGDLDAAIATYERVTGVKPINTMLFNVFPSIPATLEQAKEQALANNPNLKAARYTEKASRYEMFSNMGQLLPQVSLNGSMDREDGSSLFVDEFNTDSVLLNVRIPVYQAGTDYSRIRQAKRLHQRRKFEAMDQNNVTVEQITRAWERLMATREAIKSNEDAIRAAEIALDGVKQEQQFGARTTLDVLDAEQELFASRVNLVRSQRNEVVAVYGLLSVIGQLTPQTLGMKVDEYDPIDNYDTVKWLPIGF